MIISGDSLPSASLAITPTSVSREVSKSVCLKEPASSNVARAPFTLTSSTFILSLATPETNTESSVYSKSDTWSVGGSVSLSPRKRSSHPSNSWRTSLKSFFAKAASTCVAKFSISALRRPNSFSSWSFSLNSARRFCRPTGGPNSLSKFSASVNKVLSVSSSPASFAWWMDLIKLCSAVRSKPISSFLANFSLRVFSR